MYFHRTKCKMKECRMKHLQGVRFACSKGFQSQTRAHTECVVTLGLPSCWQHIWGWEYHQNSHFNWLSDEEIQFSAFLPCQDLKMWDWRGQKGSKRIRSEGGGGGGLNIPRSRRWARRIKTVHLGSVFLFVCLFVFEDFQAPVYEYWFTIRGYKTCLNEETK